MFIPGASFTANVRDLAGLFISCWTIYNSRGGRAKPLPRPGSSSAFRSAS